MSLTAASSEKYYNPGVSGDFEYEFQRAWELLKSFSRIIAVFRIWMVVYAIVWSQIVWLVSKLVKKFKK